MSGSQIRVDIHLCLALREAAQTLRPQRLWMRRACPECVRCLVEIVVWMKYHESLVPSVHTVLQNRVNKTDESVLAYLYIVTNLQLVLQQSLEFLWRMVLDEGSARCTAFDSETMTGMLGICITVCGSDEWDDELLYSIE